MAIKKLTVEIPQELFDRFFTYLINQSETKWNPTFQEVNAAAESALTEWLDKMEKVTVGEG
jgi:hypothetical protein